MTNGGGRVVASHIDIVLHTMGARAHTLRARHRSTCSDWPRRERFRGSKDGEEEGLKVAGVGDRLFIFAFTALKVAGVGDPCCRSRHGPGGRGRCRRTAGCAPALVVVRVTVLVNKKIARRPKDFPVEP